MDDKKELKNGYVIKFMHEHYPTMQNVMWMKKDSEGGQRIRDRVKGLRDFFLFLDYVLINEIEYEMMDFSMNEKWIRKNFQLGEFFKLFLEVNFRITRYNKVKKKPREYYFWESFKNALFEIVQVIYNKNKNNELREIYEISEPKIINEYYTQPFNQSILYDKDSLERDNELFSEFSVGIGIEPVNPNAKLFNKKPFNKIDTATLKFTQKKDVEYIYKLTKRKYNALSKVKENDFYTFDFTKSRTKVKQVQNKSRLKTYINTKVLLNANAINEAIEEYRTNLEDFIYIFSFFNLLRHYEKGTNHIIYEKKKFRLYSTKELNNGINFQFIRSKFRSIIFKDQYDYDINAGAPTLLYQYIKKKISFENIKLEYLENYIEDRKLLRKKCAEVLVKKFGKSDKEYEKGIKQIITAMFYGSNLNYSGEDDKHELKYAKRKYLLENIDEFKGLFEDAKTLFKAYEKYILNLNISNEKYELEEKVYIDKYELKDAKKEEKKINSIVCEIYFYLESKILLLMYETYKEDISLLIHDGFICRKDIEVEELEKLVKEKFDYDVKYSKDKL